MLCISVPLLFLLNDEWINAQFLVIVISTLIVCNVTLAANIVPLLKAIITDNEQSFEANAQKEMNSNT